MKSRFKIDAAWHEALQEMGDSRGVVEEMIVRYMEEGVEPNMWVAEGHCDGFRGMWIVIRAEIARRQARNARAREKRRILREAREESRRKAEEARLQAIEDQRRENERRAAEERERKRELRRMKACPRRRSISGRPISDVQTANTPATNAKRANIPPTDAKRANIPLGRPSTRGVGGGLHLPSRR